MGKAVIYIDVVIPFEISDSGYLGTKNSSIDEHIAAAKEEVQRCHVYLKRNTDNEPTLVPDAVMRLKKVVIEP